MRLALATTLAVAALAAPAAADAREKIDANRTCFLSGQGTVTITGSGFTPNVPFTATSQDGEDDSADTLKLNVQGTTGPDGSVNFSFPALKLDPGYRVGTRIKVEAGVTEDGFASGGYAATDVRFATTNAGFYPFQNFRDAFTLMDAQSGGPLGPLGGRKKLHFKQSVQFFANGFGGGELPSGPTFVFLHYVNPKGKSIRDEYIAQVRACGSASTLSGRYLFRGLKKPQPGNWKLVFDWSKRYSPRTKEQRTVFAKVDRKGYVTFPGNAIFDR